MMKVWRVADEKGQKAENDRVWAGNKPGCRCGDERQPRDGGFAFEERAEDRREVSAAVSKVAPGGTRDGVRTRKLCFYM